MKFTLDDYAKVRQASQKRLPINVFEGKEYYKIEDDLSKITDKVSERSTTNKRKENSCTYNL